MKTLKLWLGGLLALQAALAGAFYWNDQRALERSEPGPLLDFETAQIDRIVISDGDSSVTLEKAGEQWLLPDLQKLPATADKITGALERLNELQAGWPVASTNASHERFEVAAGTFQRHVQLYRGDELVDELYVGTSPGFRKVHVRRQGDDAVYAVELNSYDVPAEASEWLDKQLITANDLNRIEGPGYALEKRDDRWQWVAPDAAAEENNAAGAEAALDVAKAKQLATGLTTLRVQGVADAVPEAEPVALQINADGKDWTYTFYQQGDQYFVSRNDRDAVFTLSKYNYDRIAGVKRADLVLTEKETEDNEGSAEAATSEN